MDKEHSTHPSQDMKLMAVRMINEKLAMLKYERQQFDNYQKDIKGYLFLYTRRAWTPIQWPTNKTQETFSCCSMPGKCYL